MKLDENFSIRVDKQSGKVYLANDEDNGRVPEGEVELDIEGIPVVARDLMNIYVKSLL